LIVWGMKDFAFRDAARKRFEQAFPRHKTVLLAARHPLITGSTSDESTYFQGSGAAM
jgi:hypothetical protein